MSEIADEFIDADDMELADHEAGLCGQNGECPYCSEETNKSERKP